MSNKHNLVLYLDKELIDKSKALGFNLSRTFENHLKHLITQLTTTQNTQNHHPSISNVEVVGRTGFEPVTFCTSSRCPNRARLPALLLLRMRLDSLSLRSAIALQSLLRWSKAVSAKFPFCGFIWGVKKGGIRLQAGFPCFLCLRCC
jgi:post-segregation antitoxin (ccd killing protein)